MCGLVGVAGDVTAKSEKVMETLLILDSLRGAHSTGIAAIKTQGIDVAKEVGDPYCLFQHPDYISAMAGWSRVLIGHNRYATVGKIIAQNAHPFDVGGVVGAHNGTLNNHWAVLKKEKHMVVDSEMLLHTIDQDGVQDAIKNLDGAWALTWWDKEKEEMCFLRNKERPLFACFSEDGKQMYWASEPWMLSVALSRYEQKHSDIKPFEENVLYRLNVAKDRKMVMRPKKEVASSFRQAILNDDEYWRSAINKFLPPVGQQQHPRHSKKGNVLDASPKKPLQLVHDRDNQETALKKLETHPSLGKEGVRCKCVGKGIDGAGSCYILLVDQEHKSTEYIRLNLHAKDKADDFLQKELIVDIHTKPFWSPVTQRAYIKAVYSTHKLAEEDASPGFMDCDGKLLPHSEWMKKHGTCDWCGGNTDPNNPNTVVKKNATVCHTCIKDTEVQQLVH